MWLVAMNAIEWVIVSGGCCCCSSDGCSNEVLMAVLVSEASVAVVKQKEKALFLTLEQKVEPAVQLFPHDPTPLHSPVNISRLSPLSPSLPRLLPPTIGLPI